MQQFHLSQSKDELRQKCKKIRIELYKNGQLEKISKEIAKKISMSKEFMCSKNVMLFYPKKYEIDVLSLLDFDKVFYLPRCNSNDIEVCEYKKGDELKESEFKILEPINKALDDISVLDLIVIPALCADKNGNRLGYGGGFYDRFLKNKNLKAKKIVVVPEKLVFENIEKENFDVPCDKVISA